MAAAEHRRARTAPTAPQPWRERQRTRQELHEPAHAQEYCTLPFLRPEPACGTDVSHGGPGAKRVEALRPRNTLLRRHLHLLRHVRRPHLHHRAPSRAAGLQEDSTYVFIHQTYVRKTQRSIGSVSVQYSFIRRILSPQGTGSLSRGNDRPDQASPPRAVGCTCNPLLAAPVTLGSPRRASSASAHQVQAQDLGQGSGSVTLLTTGAPSFTTVARLPAYRLSLRGPRTPLHSTRDSDSSSHKIGLAGPGPPYIAPVPVPAAATKSASRAPAPPT